MVYWKFGFWEARLEAREMDERSIVVYRCFVRERCMEGCFVRESVRVCV